MSGGPGLPGFPGRAGLPGGIVGSDFPGPTGDPGLPGLDGEYGKYMYLFFPILSFLPTFLLFPQYLFPILSFLFSFLFPFSFLLLPFIVLASLTLVFSLLQVSRVLQVHPGPLVQAQHRETEVALGCQASLAPPAGKENLPALGAPEAPVSLVAKVE